jgi:hypothetical protein
MNIKTFRIETLKERLEQKEQEKKIAIDKYDEEMGELLTLIKEAEKENIKENGLEFMYAKCGQFFSPNKVLKLAEIDGQETLGAFGKQEHHSIIKNVSGINLAGLKLDQNKLDKIGSIISKTDVTLKIWKDGRIEVV